jgi:hypothetical protein
MKKAILTILPFLIIPIINGQTGKPNGFVDYKEFQLNQPSLILEFQLKQRTDGDIFMTGGISNYRLKKIKPASAIEKVENEIWGVKVGDTVYINSYPYSKIKGYNKIIEIGYYSYFIGEPARTEKEQRELGIIKPNESLIAVCCKTGYVILPDGSIKQLRPELLSELCADNKQINKEISKTYINLEDVYEMFDYLKKYNATKK